MRQKGSRPFKDNPTSRYSEATLKTLRHHEMHPNLFHLGPITFPVFGLMAAVGLMLALSLSLRTARLCGIDPDKIWNAGLFTVIAAFLLSRILLIVLYLHSFLAYPILLLAVPSLTPLGMGLTAIATSLYLRHQKLPFLPALDAWAPCATLLWTFLALGHLAEGSDPGLPSSMPWGLVLPSDAIRTHPVALYAALSAAIATILLYRQLSLPHRAGRPAAWALAATGIVQFFLTFFREPTSSAVLIDPIQWVGLGMILAATLLWFPVPLSKEQYPNAVQEHAPQRSATPHRKA